MDVEPREERLAMQYLLRVGQVFTCAEFRDLKYRCDTPGGFPNPPVVNKMRLHFGVDIYTANWTEKVIGDGDGRWEKHRESTVQLRIEDQNTIGSKRFTVIYTGGPANWHSYAHAVVAEDEDGRRVFFVQEGGDHLPRGAPADVELVSGPADEAQTSLWWDEDRRGKL